MAVGNREQMRSAGCYVTMTRARQHLNLVQPMRLFRGHQHRHGDGHILTMRSRLLPDGTLDLFERWAYGRCGGRDPSMASPVYRLTAEAAPTAQRRVP
jgi:hypothetical protein